MGRVSTGRAPATAVGRSPSAGRPTLAPLVAGLLVVLVGYSGPVLIITRAVEQAGLPTRVADSWLFAVSVGSGVAGLGLSWWTRQPVIVAFSTPGAVLLSTTLGDYRFSDAVAAYMVVAVVCVAIGLSSTFSRLMALIPGPIVSAMLAGVLLDFGIGAFRSLPGAPAQARVTLLVAMMIGVYFVARSRGSRLAVVWTSGAGIAVALAAGLTTGRSPRLHLAEPLWTTPTFHPGAVVTLALPLLALALSSQYAPGYAVMRGAGYTPDMNRILTVTGGFGLLLAPFGGPGLNLAAITAGIATGPDAHPDADRRWLAGVATGVVYVVVGLFGVSALSIFGLMPHEFVVAITGLALFGTIVSAAAGALTDPAQRDAAGATFLCAAGGFTLFHIGAPFWALVVGLVVARITPVRD